MTIGNFESDALTAVLQREGVSNEQNPWAYIYIDNIVIKPVKEREECSCTNDIIAQAIADPPLQLQEYHLVEINSVLFDFDESKLLEDAKLRLDSAAALLYRNTSMFLRVIGHTDIVGEAGYNMQLSEKRAQAVIDYLTEKGIDADRLSIDYKGSQDPVASNSDAEGRKQNRRVEFEVLQYDYKWVESPE